MRFFLAAFFLMTLAPFALAAEERERPCTLQNTDLCGKWEGAPVNMLVFGDRLEWSDGSFADCTVVKEERHENRAYSLLNCKETFNPEFGVLNPTDPNLLLLILRPKNYRKHNADKDERYMRLFSIEHLECSISNSLYFADKEKECDLENLEQQDYGSEPYYGD